MVNTVRVGLRLSEDNNFELKLAESLREHQKSNSFVIVFCRNRIVDPGIVLQGQQYDDGFNSFNSLVLALVFTFG